ncbi:SPOR and LysM peptidoglycan-binding domain-containing protein [Psychrobacter sp. I-STPA10]|uniref:SPOR and LysM peptidoglycan-binding domain-containing protein n=1 Tax=Psychrobacter sp. I-STPA10 TaxID=2585769 RepID=UPI001E655A78|nr:LysM peptidoglycan-binding domain-containing protein [Psychrobacter sp. I-STPA10]
MKLSRQTLLGGVLFLGGGLMLFAMVQQIDMSDTLQQDAASIQPVNAEQPQETDEMTNRPLTADIETEQRILAQKQKERAARVAEQERLAKEFLAEQEQAEVLALNKSRLENEQYRANNAIEPVPSNEDLQNEVNVTAQQEITDTSSSVQPATPVIQSRPIPAQPKPAKPAEPQNQTNTTTTQAASNNEQRNSRNQAIDYQVKRGDGLIKIAREHNVPIEVLLKANDISINTSIHQGQTLIIPSTQQVQRLQRELQAAAKTVKPKPKPTPTVAKSETTTKSQQDTTSKPQPTNTAPSRAVEYRVQRGDGLIKLAREYNVPVEALAQANNLSTSAALHVGQKLTIPSQTQISRLQREAQLAKQRAEAAKTAEQRLAQARQAAAEGEARGTFGVQVALADNQAKADEVAKKMRAAGYKVSTSATSRGVRVIVGPEEGKPAALALKDKINADPRTGVNNAWVLYWR